MPRTQDFNRVQNARVHACLTSCCLMLAACGSPEPARNVVPFAEAGPAPTAVAPVRAKAETLRSRLSLLDQAVTRWQKAPTLGVAHQSAEEARNLVVGPNGPFYGDADRDGMIRGASSIGILPGLKGEQGLASSGDNTCVIADVLGGSWADPSQRWSILRGAIERWTPRANTFPSLPSHPQRVIGWATLTLKSNRLADALEYASHARIHVDISLRATTSCRR